MLHVRDHCVSVPTVKFEHVSENSFAVRDCVCVAVPSRTHVGQWERICSHGHVNIFRMPLFVLLSWMLCHHGLCENARGNMCVCVCVCAAGLWCNSRQMGEMAETNLKGLIHLLATTKSCTAHRRVTSLTTASTYCLSVGLLVDHITLAYNVENANHALFLMKCSNCV